MKSRKPNIVLFYTDEQRHDALGCAGNPSIRTPHLDRLAAEGVRFTRTFCQGPLCQPSRASLITGRYLHEHGQTWNRFNLDPAWPNMMKELQKAGYETAVLGKTHFFWDPPVTSNDLRDNNSFVRSFGFDYVLEEYDKYKHAVPGLRSPYLDFLEKKGLCEDYRSEIPMWKWKDIGRNLAHFETFDGKTSKLPQEADLSSFIADKAIEWISATKKEKPFFVWVSFVAPHPPLISDSIWSEYYKDVDVPSGPRGLPETPDNAWGRYLKLLLGPPERYSSRISKEVMVNKIRHYYAMISLIDQCIGKVMKILESSGQDDNTWIFFTSDHGDMMGDHALMYKHTFYKGSVLVPNIIRPSGGVEPRVIDALTQSIDITRTILEVAGADIPEGCHGQPLLPLTNKRSPREAVFSELAGPMNKDNFFVMVVTDRYRYVYDRENDLPCELFDLKEDPEELQNLVEDPDYEGIRRDLHRDFIVPFMEGTLV